MSMIFAFLCVKSGSQLCYACYVLKTEGKEEAKQGEEIWASREPLLLGSVGVLSYDVASEVCFSASIWARGCKGHLSLWWSFVVAS